METKEKLQREVEDQPNLKVAAASVIPAQVDEFPWTTTDLVDAQQQDPDIGPVVKWIAWNGEDPNYSPASPIRWNGGAF